MGERGAREEFGIGGRDGLREFHAGHPVDAHCLTARRRRIVLSVDVAPAVATMPAIDADHAWPTTMRAKAHRYGKIGLQMPVSLKFGVTAPETNWISAQKATTI
jgi:hypothetical protein